MGATSGSHRNTSGRRAPFPSTSPHSPAAVEPAPCWPTGTPGSPRSTQPAELLGEAGHRCDRPPLLDFRPQVFAPIDAASKFVSIRFALQPNCDAVACVTSYRSPGPISLAFFGGVQGMAEVRTASPPAIAN